MIRGHGVQQTFLRCNVCSEDYDEEIHIPRVLPCLHTYCQVCLRKLSATNVIFCPKCRARNRLPSTGVRGLPIDTTRRNLREFIKLKKTDPCITCNDCPGDNEASDYCRYCSIYLCLDCIETHKRSIATTSHEILKIENMKVSAGPEVFRRRLKCIKSGHEGQLLAFYCSKEECRAPVCKICIEQDHKTSQGHMVQNIEEVQRQKMTELKRIFCHLADMVTSTRTIAEQLEQEILNIDIREFELERELELTFTECQRMLEKRKEDLKAEISKLCKRQRVVLASKSEKMGNFIDTVENATDFSRNISTHSGPSEFLSLYNILLRRLRLLTRHQLNKSIELAVPSFDTQHVLTQFRALTSALGTISTETHPRNLRLFRNTTDLSTTSRPLSIRLDAGHTDVIFPEIMLDRDTVHKYRDVSDCGRKLLSKPTSKKKTGQTSYPSRQLQTYRGVVGNRSFHQPGRFYFEVVVDINILKDLENSNFVFEVGLCSLKEIDRGHYLYEQDHAWSLCGQHCERHDMVCRFLRHRGHNLMHTELVSRTAGPHICERYGFLLDTELSRLTVYDCLTQTKIFTFDDVGPCLELWPVFGCHWPSKVDVTITVRGGRDITLPDVSATRSLTTVT